MKGAFKLNSSSPIEIEKEKLRLNTLKECRIIDTPEEREFDDITQIASNICDMPISVISFVDDSRQWFKSKVGLEVTQTPRDISFCSHTIRGTEPLIITDAAIDSRFEKNPLVTGEPFVRFYAGVPLLISPGHAVGTLCVIDQKPRELNVKQLTALKLLANQVCDQIGRRKAVLLHEEQRQKVSEGSRLAALREMAAGLAHEINNPLAIIQLKAAYIENVVSMDLKDKSVIIENAQSISAMTSRVLKIVKGFNTFANACALEEFEQVKLGVLLDDVLVFCNDKLKNSLVTLKIKDEAKQIEVCGNSVLLSQVFLNLINNAVDAVHGLEDRWIMIHAESSSCEVRITIENSGDPIPHEVQSKIFQPFFTTKQAGKGTGLGLSITSGILKSHNGAINYDPKAQNPRFVITLPQYSKIN